MSMCIHGQEFETCRFGCTLRNAKELRLENDKLKKEFEKQGIDPDYEAMMADVASDLA